MLLFSFLDMIAFADRHSFFYAGLNVACNRFQKYNFFTNNNPVTVYNFGIYKYIKYQNCSLCLQPITPLPFSTAWTAPTTMPWHRLMQDWLTMAMLFLHICQTGGKGQRGKTWQTGNGENIAISIIIEPKHLQVAEQFNLSVAVALGCYDFFSAYAGDETFIKWPNDIYWRDRKAGGVLIENVIGKDIIRRKE